MKWLVVACALLASVALGLVARDKRRLRVAMATALGFLPFVPITLNPVSYESYRGDARGVEFTLVDFVAVALAVALGGRGRWRRPYAIAGTLYFLAAVLSVGQASSTLFAMFAVWKVFRVLRVLSTVARAGQVDGLVPDVCRGLALGLVYSAALALQQRYLQGVMQARGPFSHQNGLGMAANLVFPACFAMLLAGQGGRTAKLGVGAAAICVVLTLSRGGMLLFAIAAAAVFLGSLARRLTGRKLAVLGVGVMAVAAVLVKSWDTIVERFGSAPDASAEARKLFEEAARRMLHDHPLGVGINQFSHVLDERYADQVGLPAVDRDGLVHNVYWLTAAEMGWLGIVAFVVFVAAPVLLAARAAVKDRSIRGDVMMGLGVGLLVTLLQGKLEWSLRTTQLSYLLWTVAGLVFALHATRPAPRAR